MTLEYILLLAVASIVLLKPLLEAPKRGFNEGTVRLAARVETQIATGSGFKPYTGGGSSGGDVGKVPWVKENNENGQLAIEAILLISVLIGVFVAATTSIKQSGAIQKLFDKPVIALRNMTGYGTFKETCRGLGARSNQQRLSNCHPNSSSRGLSSDPNP